MPECYIRGNTIKYLRVPDEVCIEVSTALLSLVREHISGSNITSFGVWFMDTILISHKIKGLNEIYVILCGGPMWNFIKFFDRTLLRFG